MSEMITKELSVGYDKKPIVENISLAVRAGKIVVLIGPNGAGKSTILKTVAGLLEPLQGSVFLEGEALDQLTTRQKAQQIASMMTDRFSTEYSTVSEVVAGGRYPYTGLLGKLSSEDKEIIDDALEMVGAGAQKEEAFSRLSDGQKQRVLLARAIAQKPAYMILDEPTSFLDIGYKLSFIETLKQLAKKEKKGILMSLHELELAALVADVVVCVSKKGKIDRIGSPEEIFQNRYIEGLFEVKPGLLRKTYHFEKGFNTVSQIQAKLAHPQAKFLMVQGTMSNAGKSLIVAGLCRILKQDGYKVAPFKAQNMALNSYVTEEGLEMGRAQVMQAEAAGIKPSVSMNPILLKPTSDSGSQVIVNGKVRGNMSAREYFAYKTALVGDILAAVEKLQQQADIILIEGAGSPAEINLKENDIVNMGMAEMVDAPVLLVGDIDRGGVFAQLLGTIALLEERERQRVKGLVVNKFRGDISILEGGITMLEEKSEIPVAGVIPYMQLQLEDEDSLSEKFDSKKPGLLNIGVIRFPHIANYTDFDVFQQIQELSVHYITNPQDILSMDMIILPGSKNTISDMTWLREKGWEPVIKQYSAANGPLLGICGGYQMLGEKIRDPLGVEGGGEIAGLGLLPVETTLAGEKHRSQVSGEFINPTGIFADLKNCSYQGYELHMGETSALTPSLEAFTKASGYCKGNVWGSYVHGLFDQADIVKRILKALAQKKGVEIPLTQVMSYRERKELEYDRLADTMRNYMNMPMIYDIIGVNK